jgi:hypothetical protein
MRILTTLIFLITALPVFAMPAKGTLAGGIILGEPTGLSAKSYVTSTQAFDAALSYSLRTDSVWLHGDYLYHSESLSKSVQGGRWVPYGGVGGLLYLSNQKEKQNSRALIAARLPGGLLFYPTESSFEFFAEIGLIVGILPASEVSMNGGIGSRYLF